MKVTADSDDGVSGRTDSSLSVHLKTGNGERITFKAQEIKSPNKDKKILARFLQKVRLPKSAPEYDDMEVQQPIFKHVEPSLDINDPMELEESGTPPDSSSISDSSKSVCTPKRETSSESEENSDSASSWSSTIPVLKTGATYTKIPPVMPVPVVEPEPTEGEQPQRRRYEVPELQFDFTFEDLKKVKCLRYFPPGYIESLPNLIKLKPEPRTHARKLHELNDDWERFEMDLARHCKKRKYIHEKRQRLLAMLKKDEEPPRRFIGNEGKFSLHEFLIAQARFLMDMPGYKPEKDFPLHKVYDLKAMKYRVRRRGVKPKLDSKDDPTMQSASSVSHSPQETLGRKDDSTLPSLQSMRDDDGDDTRFLYSFKKEEPSSGMQNDEDEKSEESDMQSSEKDEDLEHLEEESDKGDMKNLEKDEDSENSDGEGDMESSKRDKDSDGEGDMQSSEDEEAEKENSGQESGEDSEQEDQQHSDKDESDNEGGYDSDEENDSEYMDEAEDF